MSRPIRLTEPVFRRMPDRVHGPLIRQVGLVSSPNWSGAVINAPAGSTFASAVGTWTVPITNASEPDGDTDLSLWVGIDGYGSRDVFQAGINATARNGQSTDYSAWWEWFPEFEVRIDNLGVAPGQMIECRLAIISNKSGTIFLHNVTTGVAIPFQVTAPAGTTLVGDTAEWIAERPGLVDPPQTTILADYGRAAFVSVAATTHTGISGMSSAAILGETSPFAPAISALNGRLYLSWSGVDVSLISIACSTDSGASFGNKFISIERTSDAPALCPHNGNLFLAWKGVDNPKLTIAAVRLAGDTITGLINRVVLGEISPDSPALSSLNGRLYLAWRGVDNNLLSIACSTDNGRSFGNKFVSQETSSDAPALCAHDGNVFLAWKGVDNTQITVARVLLNGDAITGLTRKVVLGETTAFGPALASSNGRLFLSWRGSDNPQLSVMCSSDDARTFEQKFSAQETSSDSPALCANNGQVFAAWKGVDNTKLTVAVASEAGEAEQAIDLRAAFTLEMSENNMIVSVASIQSPTEVDCVYTGPRLPTIPPPVILGETSPNGPALASLNGRLFLSWRGVDNNQLSVSYSLDDGRTFGHKLITQETTSDAPALCAHNGNLLLAWKGVDNPKLTVATVVISGDTIAGLTDKTVLGEISPTSPTLASLNGRLYLAWRGVDNNLLSIACSTDNGRTFPHKFVAQETSSDAPVLCAHNGNLFLGWKGVDNPQLSVAQVTLSGDAITGLSGKTILGETSVLAPAMASLNGRLFLCWRGSDNFQLSVAYSLDNGRSFGNKFMSTERSTDSPGLCAHDNSLFAAWKGVDNTNLSVAAVLI